MATSNVEIANRALQLLGSSGRIESLSEDSPNARTLTAAFERVRNALQRRYRWHFCKKRASLAADSDETEWGELNRFAFPNDYVRLIRDDESGVRLDWKIEGRFIVTKDAAPLNIKYCAIIIDPQQFDPLFDELLAHHLAIATCKEVTGSKPSDVLMDMTADALAAAKQGNAYEEDAEEPLQDEWINARL